MKRIIVLLAAVAGMSVLAGCAGGAPAVKTTDDGRAVAGGMPQFVKDAIKGIPEGTLAGVGSAKIGAAGLNQARTIAAARARAEIARQLNTASTEAILDVVQANEADPESAVAYQETVNVQLSKAELAGVSIIEQDQDASGNYWVVATMGKVDAVKTITAAQAAAKLAVPQAAALDATARLNALVDKVAAQEAANY
jgi:hypothetical protein